MFDVIEHLPKDREEECLVGIKKILKDGGLLVISTPNNSLLSKILDPAWYFGHRHYSKNVIIGILSKVGFKVKSYFFWKNFCLT